VCVCACVCEYVCACTVAASGAAPVFCVHVCVCACVCEYVCACTVAALVLLLCFVYTCVRVCARYNCTALHVAVGVAPACVRL
jgi:hypothetical protein